MRLVPPAARRLSWGRLFSIISVPCCITKQTERLGEHYQSRDRSPGDQVGLATIQGPGLHPARVFTLEADAFSAPACGRAAKLRNPPDVHHQVDGVSSCERSFNAKHT